MGAAGCSTAAAREVESVMAAAEIRWLNSLWEVAIATAVCDMEVVVVVAVAGWKGSAAMGGWNRHVQA